MDAQQGMKFWAIWMFIATLSTVAVTGIGVWFVKKTLETNSDFLKESIKATKAMNRQNELTEHAQRPWLQISTKVAKVETKGSLLLRCDITITNVGKMVAECCAVRTVIITPIRASSEDHLVESARANAEEAANGRMSADLSPYPLLPGESTTFSSQNEARGHLMPATVGHSANDRLHYIVFAAARYRIPGDDIFRKTDRAFCFTYGETEEIRNDPFSSMGLPFPLPDDISIETVYMRRAGHNRTT
ncbi:hypothetical protein CHN51_16575 [Sphingorhabdus sp. YGSMI21]|nr:hypothetical protein CHN51_16575 [Sphingorhabdus sp. YGSMI21]